MAGSPEIFADGDDVPEHRTFESERPLAVTTILETVHGDSDRWASPDVADLDPPTTFPPDVAG
jgi:hypothetical protein